MGEPIARCERCESPIERGDLRCSICGQAAPSAATSRRRDVEVQVLRCAGCGAAVAYDPQHRAPRCSFCDSVFHVETVEDPMEQSEGFLPFTVRPEEARGALKRWLGTLGWFRPADLKSEARLESLKPLWWVGWVFDAEALVSWTGDSNAGSRRSSWAPHAGEATMEFDDILVSASRGLNDDEVRRLAPSCDLSSVRAAPEGVEGATVEQFDLQRSQARQRIAQAIEETARARVTADHIPGTRHRNVHVAVLLRRLATRRLAFPAYVLAYRYRDDLYRAVVCGQDASCVHGSAPLSLAKIAVVTAFGLLVAAAVVAIVLSSL